MEHFEIKISDGERTITIKSIDDLSQLPDKSLKILFENSNYMATLYSYVIHRMDAYLQIKKYPKETRLECLDMCIKNLNSLLAYERELLADNSTVFAIVSEKFSEPFQAIYEECVIATCNFFAGVLSTTSYLDRNLFSRDDKQRVRHYYGNMISALIVSVEK